MNKSLQKEYNAMGMLEYIEDGGDQYTISMIKWGVFRRFFTFLFYAIRKPNQFEFPSFVPAYELAIFQSSRVRRPIILIHFVNARAAHDGWGSVTSAMREQGLKGALDYVCNIKIGEKKEFGNIYGVSDSEFLEALEEACEPKDKAPPGHPHSES